MAAAQQPRMDLATALQLEQSFLRLASTPAIFTAYQAAVITNRDALAALQAFDALPQVDQIDEPFGIEVLWWRLAGLDQPSRSAAARA